MESSVSGWYRGLVERGVLAPDEAQENAVLLLQNLANSIAAPQSNIRSDWRRFWECGR